MWQIIDRSMENKEELVMDMFGCEWVGRSRELVCTRKQKRSRAPSRKRTDTADCDQRKEIKVGMISEVSSRSLLNESNAV
mmetsp:Transcript_72/g.124  ORF Transcript_72/g.124 Transcript_72/m.124 type:complete len:80 (-) Transcript_72:163-402(-)